MKKALVGLMSVSMLVLMAVPALAWFGAGQEVVGNTAFVTNTANSTASSGNNVINGNGTNTILTGNTTSQSLASNTINSNVDVGCCGGFGSEQEVKYNTAIVTNTANSTAKSGYNQINSSSFWGGENFIGTGNTQSVSIADTTANSNIDEGCCGFGSGQEVKSNFAVVKNSSTALATSGSNTINSQSFCGGDNWIQTGSDFSSASAFTTVNSNIKRSIVIPQ